MTSIPMMVQSPQQQPGAVRPVAALQPQQPSQQAQPRPPQVQAQARPQQPQQQSQSSNTRGGPNLRNAPVIRSLVSLTREDCRIDRSEDGSFVTLRLSASMPGEASVFFLAMVSGEAAEALPHVQAVQVSKQNFAQGSQQQLRLFLCKDMQENLARFPVPEKTPKGEKDRYHIVIDLHAESQDNTAITAQRSALKLNSDSTAATVVAQWVQRGSVVRPLQALYGTLPNPAEDRDSATASAGLSSDAESGECVICLSKPREVAILHCRHVCLCRSCAQISKSTWSFQCPVCRGRVAAFVCAQPQGITST